MERLTELVSLCKVSVTLSVNEHKEFYETVESYLKDRFYVEENVLEQMIEKDTLICIQAYPKTPVSFLIVLHYDINEAIEIMINKIKESCEPIQI